MKVLQYYYTSYVQPRKGRAGFQVKAMSPGIDTSLQALIARLIAYCIPASCDASALATHPIALRYYRTEAGTDILLCSQSSGKDEYGRPGNFFAHVVILEAHRFTNIPPIFFWKSSFWRKSDVEEREEIISLPVLSAFEGETTLSIQDVWSFLSHAPRRFLLYKLLCAVISSRKMQQRIVIFDTDKHVALWIAAVSCLLPPEYRPFVTFATYHHDPHQAQYLITGTLKSASSFTTLSNSCFILDAETGQTSPFETSLYAALAIQAAQPDLYETWLLPLFQISQRRFPQPTTIDDTLNSIALYARLLRRQTYQLLTSEEHSALQFVLAAFERQAQYTQQDIDELLQLRRALRASMKTSLQQTDYQRVLAQLNIHHSTSLDEIFLEELQQLTEQFASQSVESSLEHISTLCQLYGQQRLINVLNSQTSFFSRRNKEGVTSLLALTSGSMPPELVWQVSRYLEDFGIQEYSTILEYSIPVFLRQDISQQTHTSLIQALFPHSMRLGITSHFWKLYLQTFSNLLANQSSERLALTLLDFWFGASDAFHYGYPVQQFFLLLPTCQLIVNKLAANGLSLTSRFPALQVIFTRPPAFLTAVSNALVNWMQHYIVEEEQKKERAREKQLLKTTINQLFERGMVIERHCKLAELYSVVSAEQFWSLYWKQFLHLFTSENLDDILAVFAFWFDHSYSVLAPAYTLPQEFFLGLTRVLQRERSARKVIEALHEKIVQEELPYSWFSALQNCVKGRINE